MGRKLRFDNGRVVDATQEWFCLACGATLEPESRAEPHDEDCQYAEE